MHARVKSTLYGLYLGPEITHSLETASSETTNFEFDRSGGTGASTAQRVNCHGIRPSGIIHMPDASGPMALQPSDSHSGCCTSSIWGAEPHQNPQFGISARTQVSPPMSPTSCTCPMPSHCIFRWNLIDLLTVCVAGTPYVAIWPPWSDPGTALEPDQHPAAAR